MIFMGRGGKIDFWFVRFFIFFFFYQSFLKIEKKGVEVFTSWLSRTAAISSKTRPWFRVLEYSSAPKIEISKKIRKRVILPMRLLGTAEESFDFFRGSGDVSMFWNWLLVFERDINFDWCIEIQSWSKLLLIFYSS